MLHTFFICIIFVGSIEAQHMLLAVASSSQGLLGHLEQPLLWTLCTGAMLGGKGSPRCQDEALGSCAPRSYTLPCTLYSTQGLRQVGASLGSWGHVAIG